MNRHRVPLTLALLAIAGSGLGACGGDDQGDRVREQGRQIQQDAAGLRERAAQVTKDAKAGKDTKQAQEQLEKDAADIDAKTKAVAGDALEDAKGKVGNDAAKQAIEDAQSQLESAPTP